MEPHILMGHIIINIFFIYCLIFIAFQIKTRITVVGNNRVPIKKYGQNIDEIAQLGLSISKRRRYHRQMVERIHKKGIKNDRFIASISFQISILLIMMYYYVSYFLI